MGVPLERIAVFSVDNDNCVANKKFLDLQTRPEGFMPLSIASCVEMANTGLIHFIQERLKSFKAGFLMIGTNRQDKTTDDSNAFSKKNGSFLPVVRALHAGITKNPTCSPLTLDGYLLSDGEARGGTQFNLIEKFQTLQEKLTKLDQSKSTAKSETEKKALEKETIKIKLQMKKITAHFTKWIFDSSKFSILYAQVHRIAAKHPKAQIEFNFLDDLEDILTGPAVYVAPSLPDFINPEADANRHAEKERLAYRLRNKIIFTPQGLYIYQQGGPVWGFKQIVSRDNPEAEMLASYLAKAEASSELRSIKQDLSKDEINQLDNLLDEKGCRSVSGLAGIFSKFPELLPKNVKLLLHRYDGEKFVRNVAVIDGKGEIDYDYKKSTLSMARALTNVEDENKAASYEYDIGDLYRKYRFREEAQIQQIEAFLTAPHLSTGNGKDLKSAMAELSNLLHDDFNKQFADSTMKREEVLLSPAGKIFFELEVLKRSLYAEDKGVGEKLMDIKAFEDACCNKEPRYKIFFKSVALVISAAVGFVLGAAIGFGIGYAAGAWSGPLAVVSAVAGLVKGSLTGQAIGLAIGASLTGVAAATATGVLLFKPDSLTKAARKVVDRARGDEKLLERQPVVRG